MGNTNVKYYEWVLHIHMNLPVVFWYGRNAIVRLVDCNVAAIAKYYQIIRKYSAALANITNIIICRFSVAHCNDLE